MSTNHAHQKLARIEKLIDLKRSAKQVKEDLQAYVISKTEELKTNSQSADFNFDIDKELANFLTTFDDKVHEIEKELMNIAA